MKTFSIHPPKLTKSCSLIQLLNDTSRSIFPFIKLRIQINNEPQTQIFNQISLPRSMKCPVHNNSSAFTPPPPFKLLRNARAALAHPPTAVCEKRPHKGTNAPTSNTCLTYRTPPPVPATVSHFEIPRFLAGVEIPISNFSNNSKNNASS